jgi:hypothetical protein
MEVGALMAFNFYHNQSSKITVGDLFGSYDRTIEFQVNSFKITAASAHNKTYRSISAGLSNQSINLESITASNPGKSIMIMADQPIDVRLGASDASMISSVYQLVIAVSNTVSSVFIGVPGSIAAANVMVHVVAGGTLSVSLPLP